MSDRAFLAALAALAFALPFAAGGPSLKNGFLNFDDPGMIVENPRLDAPDASDAAAAFLERREHAYLPVYVLALIPDAAFFGKDPRGYHLSSLFWHGLSALAAGLFVHALFRSRTATLFATAVFAVHPAAAESVAWASGRKDQACVVLVFLGLSAALGHLRRGGAGRAAGAAGFLALALLAKGAAVAFPLLLAATWLVVRRDGTLSPRARPGRLIALCSLVAAAGAGLHLWVALDEGAAAADPGAGTAGERALRFLAALGRYATSLVAPARLSIHYDLRDGGSTAGRTLGAVVALGFVAGLVALVLGRSARGRAAGFASTFLAASLLPFNGVFPSSSLAAADRYLIVGLPAFGVLLGVAASWFAPRARLVVLGCALAALVPIARARYAEFADGETVFRAAMRLDPEDALPPLKVGEAIRERRPGLPSRTAEAADLFSASARRSRDPVREARARTLLADTKLGDSKFEEALAEYDRIEEIRRANADLLRRFGFDGRTVRFNRAAALLGAGRTVSARAELEALLDSDAKFLPALLLLADLDRRHGFETLDSGAEGPVVDRARELVHRAIAAYESASKEAGRRRAAATNAADRAAADDFALRSGASLARTLARATWRSNALNDALAAAEALKREFPRRAEPWLVRADVLRAADPSASARDVAEAAAREPGSTAALRALADVMAAAGRNTDAVRLLRGARALAPDDAAIARALYDLYVASARSHLDPEAGAGKRDVKKAKIAAREARTYVKDGPEAWALEGRCEELENSWDAAAGCYAAARARDPLNDDASKGLARYHQARGLAYLANRRAAAATRPAESRAAEAEAVDRATAEFRTALALAPDADELAFARSRLRDLDRSGTVDPILEKAGAALARGDTEAALALVDGARRMDDAYFRTFLLAGHAAVQAGDYEGAQKAFKRTLELDPDNLPALLQSAWICYRRGEFDESDRRARRFLKVAEEYEPSPFIVEQSERARGLIEGAASRRASKRPP